WFEEAQTVWADPRSMEFFDPEHSEEEDRFLRIGYSTGGRLLLIVFCERASGGVIRLISARRATAKETKTYEEGISALWKCSGGEKERCRRARDVQRPGYRIRRRSCIWLHRRFFSIRSARS